MAAIHIRNVPESVVAALRERAAQRGHSMQQELLQILEAAAAEPPAGQRVSPIRLVTVKTTGDHTWSRTEIYGDEDR
jgi:plasmid stability protein